MNAVYLMLCLLQFPTDPVRAQETAVMIARSQVPVVNESPANGLSSYQQKVQLRRFEERFNQLVQAVEEFSVAYNQNKGQAWPNEKAEALRKAMAALQKVDPNLKTRDSKTSAEAKNDPAR